MEWEVGEPLHVDDSASCHARGPPALAIQCTPLSVVVAEIELPLDTVFGYHTRPLSPCRVYSLCREKSLYL